MLPLVYHPIYSALSLPEKHRYPINKYRLLYEAIMDSAHANKVSVHQPNKADINKVKALHAPEYVDALCNNQLPAAKMRRIGFPWSEALIERTLFSTGGTQLTVDLALEHGIAIHLSGGYHHAHHDFGSGFCLFNDLAFAAKHALSYTHIDKVMIIDCDVHHGDGTATLLADNPNIITFSVHCDKNFPARKPDSTIDLALPRETSTEDYLNAFTGLLPLALAQYQPDLVIYDAGVDIHQHDELGYFNVSTSGLYQRDHAVLSLCKERNIPVAAVIGGGYRTQHQELVDLHMQLIYAALSTNNE
ncbi:histone deacetylase family protein [Photobacterium leiognathi]|uniref:histone deacetylase family protein n=1 Tax=Photobacterium leiognathi TaxID=553611 RepID=UPI0002088496|nr:histone deacetylase [Photobacterium leiognathi]PSW54415.1 histone deacetylase [Photobacterium leiognathi subsp. mandapamensis]GAA03576.1 histone deacetylase domain protein [Photobacterium leiognathi subsp. mandapamensis svers.1.1.]